MFVELRMSCLEGVRILDFGYYRQGRGYANGYAQYKFWILRMCELFGFPDSGAHQAGLKFTLPLHC
jgi:hypothetical protein